MNNTTLQGILLVTKSAQSEPIELLLNEELSNGLLSPVLLVSSHLLRKGVTPGTLELIKTDGSKLLLNSELLPDNELASLEAALRLLGLELVDDALLAGYRVDRADLLELSGAALLAAQ